MPARHKKPTKGIFFPVPEGFLLIPKKSNLWAHDQIRTPELGIMHSKSAYQDFQEGFLDFIHQRVRVVRAYCRDRKDAWGTPNEPWWDSIEDYIVTWCEHLTPDELYHFGLKLLRDIPELAFLKWLLRALPDTCTGVVEGVSSALLPLHAGVLQAVLDDPGPKSKWHSQLQQAVGRPSTAYEEVKLGAPQHPADLLGFMEASVTVLQNFPLKAELLEPTQPRHFYPEFDSGFFNHRNLYDMIVAKLTQSFKHISVEEECRIGLLLLPKIPTYLKLSYLKWLFTCIPETSTVAVSRIRLSFAQRDLQVLRDALAELRTTCTSGAKLGWCDQLCDFLRGKEQTEKKNTSKKRAREVRTEVGPTPKSVRTEEGVEETDEGDTSEDGDTTDTEEINVGPDP